MAQHETSGSYSRTEGWLTPTAAGIAGLTIATLSLLSTGAWGYVVQGWLSRNGSGDFGDGVTLNGVAQIVLALLALVLATRALRGSEPAARHLGGAAVVVGALGVAIGVLTVLAGMAGF